MFPGEAHRLPRGCKIGLRLTTTRPSCFFVTLKTPVWGLGLAPPAGKSSHSHANQLPRSVLFAESGHEIPFDRASNLWQRDGHSLMKSP